MLLRLVIALAVVVLIAVPVSAEIPPEVAARLEGAVTPGDPKVFTGAYRLLVESVVAKADGADRREMAFESEISVSPGGDEVRRLIRFMVDGEDQTEKHRPKFEASDGGRDRDGEELVVPVGEDAARFRVGPVRTVEGEHRVSFEPAPGHLKDANMSRGELAWDPDTLDPLWASLEALRPPRPLRSLTLRLEYGRQDGALYLRRMVSEGRVKILLLERTFFADTRFEDVRPAATPGP